MSAGTVMSVLPEEFGTSPCKRPRKDEESANPSIRNYFSPVSRTMDKVLSSPRSSNIADYFIRSSPVVDNECTPNHKISSPEHGPAPSTPLSVARNSKQQPRRTRLVRRLCDEGGSPPGNSVFMGSDTAALLAEICSQDLSESASSGHHTTKGRQKPAKPVTMNGPPEDPPGGDPPLPCDYSTADDSSQDMHTDNILTISFEDFVKSQSEKEPTASESSPHGTSDDHVDSAEASQQPSPKTVTIQAQVHLSPPLSDSSSPTRPPTKIASIFRRKKSVEAEQKHGDHVIPKRKSNVVIEEEDLELAVIDVEAVEPLKPKCTTAERQQFMKAFRQAGETPKNPPKKCPGKKKGSNTAEGPEELQDQAEKEDTPSDNKPEEPVKATKPKRGLKRAKRVGSEETPPPVPESKAEPEPQTPEVTKSPQQSPVLRRSLRRPARPMTTTMSPSRAESPVPMSTPSRKSDVYKSEVLTVPSDTESPIRMRFTRIGRGMSGQRWVTTSEDEVFTPGRRKTSHGANKAKKILEKAKAIQQNIAKAETPQRRSTRQQKRLSQEPIVVEGTRKTPISRPQQQSMTEPQEKKPANLRSLNDVLGRKEKRKVSAGQKKDVKKKAPTCAVITIDDSSEVSEASQDDEQFKSRREFLMSGLPDSLKRNIAKAAALREAYALSSLSFHSVVHVQQRDGCEKWDLAMPGCTLLRERLPAPEDVPDVTSLALSVGDFTSWSVSLALRRPPQVVSRRVAFSEAIRDVLLEEIRWYNPQFPVRRFLNQFVKKQKDYLALQDTSKPGGSQPDMKPLIDANNGAKRKRKDSPVPKSKRRKGDAGNEEPSDQGAARPRKGRLSRGSLRKSGPSPDVLVIEEEAEPESPVWEDVLWTEKYQPQSSAELIGNSASIRRLYSWLKDWKTRADKEEKKTQMQKNGKDKNDTWDQEDFNGEDSDEDSLCNTMLITGPPGVGKTAAVYACAQELGFKVFEVNASGQRSGRQILAQLKEATQSHQVDQQGVSAHKPCFFSSFTSLGKSPRKVHSPRAVVSSPRKPPMSPRGGKKGLAPKSLSNFFKAAPKQKSEERRPEPKVPASDGKTGGSKVKPLPFIAEKGGEETQRKSATSLILFEEVDVIFDEDSGFLSAIKTFMSTTKRPVIMTTSDEMFGMMFDGVFEEITFHTPSLVNVATYLQVLCLAENIRTDMKDLMTFLTANACDIRQSVLQLQFWARSGGGGRLGEKELPPPAGKRATAVESAVEEDTGKGCHNGAVDLTQLPACHMGCAENLIGLGNVIPPTEGLIPYVKGNICNPEERNRIVCLLAEFQTRNQHFISSNLEFLFPLPLHVNESNGPAPCDTDLAPPPDEDRVKVSTQMRRRRKLLLLDDSDLFDGDSRSMDEILPDEKCPSEESGRGAAQSAHVRRQLTAAELRSSALVYTCLDSLATFADNLSYVDSWTCEAADQTDACNLNWTESRLRDGLCDSLRIETTDGVTAQAAGEMRAHMEGLAYYRCFSELTKAMDSSLEQCRQAGHDPTQELTLHVPREDVSFRKPCHTTSSGNTRLSTARTVLSNRAFASLGNRQVNVTEYLPALRSICRIEKAKEGAKTKRRFLHYLEGIHLELPKTTLNSLAADFP